MADGFDIKIDGAAEVEKALDKIAWASTSRGMARVLGDLGLVLTKRANKSFTQATAPEYTGGTDNAGRQWAPLAESTKHGRRKGKRKTGRGHKTLIDSGTLRASIEADYNTAKASVAVGTALEYGLYHQTGTKPYTIVPRNKKCLVFMGPSGETVFAKKVHHPGLQARPFIGYNKEDIEGMLHIIVRHLRKAAG